MVSRATRLIAFALVSLFTACSSESPSEPGSDTPRASMIDSGGGEVTAESVGVAARLELPPGAVVEPTAVALEGVEPVGSERVRFRIRPPALLLHQDATLEIEFPAGDEPARWTPFLAMGEEAVPLASEANGSTLSLKLRSFGYPTGSAGKLDEAYVVLDEIDCELALGFLHDRILTLQAWSTASGAPSLLAAEVGALRQQVRVIQELCQENPDYGPEMQFLEEVACASYESAAVDVEAVVAPGKMEDFDEQMAMVFGGQAMVAMSGASCGPDFAGVLASESDGFIAAWNERIQEPGYLSGLGPWTILWGELRLAALDLKSRLSLMGLENSEQLLDSTLLPNMYAGLYEIAYAACGEDHSQAFLADLYTGGHYRGHAVNGEVAPPDWSPISSAQLEADIQYCASALNVEVFDAVSEPIASYDLGGGSEPGAQDSQVELSVPADGFIDLRGPVHAFFCSPSGAPSGFEGDQLRIRVNGQPLANFSTIGGTMLASPYPISIAEVLEQLGLSEENDTTLEFLVSRKSPACQLLYGEPEYELFRITAEVEGQCSGKKSCVDLVVQFLLPETMTPGEAEVLYGSVVYVDGDGNHEDAGDEVTVQLSMQGGTINPTTVYPDDGEIYAEVEINPLADELVVTATAQGPDGLQATWTATSLNVDRLPIRLIGHYLRAWHGLPRFGNYYWDSHPGTERSRQAVDRRLTDEGSDQNGSYTATCNLVVESVPSFDEQSLLSGLNATARIESSGASAGGNLIANGQIQLTYTLQINQGNWRVELDGELATEGALSGAVYTEANHRDPDEEYDHIPRDENRTISIDDSFVLGPGEYQIYLQCRAQGSANINSEDPDFDAEASFELEVKLERL